MNKAATQLLWGNLLFLVITPALAIVLVPLYLWKAGFEPSLLIALLALWVATGLGITAGYHRLFAHRAWSAPAPVRLVLALLGGATWQNSVITWSAGHRYHHKHVDTEQDPYNAQRGFWYSHMAWIWTRGPHHDDLRNVPDLWKDPVCVWQHRNYLWSSTAFNLLVPLALGLWTGRLWGMLLFAGLLRVVVVHHSTFFINSLAHMWGTQPWSTAHSARDNAFLAVLTLGEGYHNFHHSFPADYRNGIRWFQLDPTKWTIWTLSRLRLASDLKRSTVDTQLTKKLRQLHLQYDARVAELGESLQEQIHQTELQLQQAMVEFRAMRLTLSRQSDELQRSARRELKRHMRAARRSMDQQFRSYRRLVLDAA